MDIDLAIWNCNVLRSRHFRYFSRLITVILSLLLLSLLLSLDSMD